MTAPANDLTPTIGAATARRIEMAFAAADACVLTGKATAKLLGVDEKSLRALTDDGVIRAVRRGGGRTRAYTEQDIRDYLTQSDAPKREAKPRASGQASTKVVPFSQRAKTKRA